MNIKNISRFFYPDEKIKYISVEIVVINFILIKNIKNINYFVKLIKLNYYYHQKINIFNLKIYKIQFNIILFVMLILNLK